jgi:hypothetical protein
MSVLKDGLASSRLLQRRALGRRRAAIREFRKVVIRYRSYLWCIFGRTKPNYLEESKTLRFSTEIPLAFGTRVGSKLRRPSAEPSILRRLSSLSELALRQEEAGATARSRDAAGHRRRVTATRRRAGSLGRKLQRSTAIHRKSKSVRTLTSPSSHGARTME